MTMVAAPGPIDGCCGTAGHRQGRGPLQFDRRRTRGGGPWPLPCLRTPRPRLLARHAGNSKPSAEDWWSLGDAEPVELAPVVVQVSEANLGRARTAFTVPDLPPATYALMFCDAGCAHPLADVVPTRSFTLVADRATAELAVRTTRLEERLRFQARSLTQARAVGRRARAAVASTDSELRALEEQVRGLRRKAAEAAPSSLLSRWPVAGWVVAGVFAGALASLLLRRRSTKVSPHSLDGWQPSDEELAALIATERSRARPPRELA
jgi:hypothetical protein